MNQWNHVSLAVELSPPVSWDSAIEAQLTNIKTATKMINPRANQLCPNHLTKFITIPL